MARPLDSQEGERQMRRTTLAATGIGALVAVSLALLGPAGAGAQTPSGPTTTVSPGSNSSVVASANDLKPFKVSERKNIGPPEASGAP